MKSNSPPDVTCSYAQSAFGRLCQQKFNSLRYRLIRSYFLQTKYWRQHDPFLLLKEDTFKKSSVAIESTSLIIVYDMFQTSSCCRSDILFNLELGNTMHELKADKDELSSDPAKLLVLFQEMVQICLWYDVCTAYPYIWTTKYDLTQGKRDGNV